jgi:hypothetical protein
MAITSQLAEIYAALAAVDVTLNSEVIGTRTPATMKGRINDVDLPLRVLSPVGPDGGGGTVGTMTLSQMRTATWTIFELVLLAPAHKAAGLRDYAEDIVALQEAWVSAMAEQRQLLSGVSINEVKIDAAIFKYGAGEYFAVEFQISVTEVLQRG